MSELPSTQLNFADDQRYLPRWEVANRIQYSFHHTEEPREAMTCDVSCSGLCLRAPEKVFDEGKKVRLKLFLSSLTQVDLTGTVVWVKETEGQAIAGIRLFNTEEDAQDLILAHAYELDKHKLREMWYRDWS